MRAELPLRGVFQPLQFRLTMKHQSLMFPTRWSLTYKAFAGAGLVIGLVIFLSIAILGSVANRRIFTEEMADAIHARMTRREVEALLGGPRGDFTTGPCTLFVGSNWVVCWELWISDVGAIAVDFDDKEQVSSVEFIPVKREQNRGFIVDTLVRLRIMRLDKKRDIQIVDER
jgi:hypothetical protein